MITIDAGMLSFIGISGLLIFANIVFIYGTCQYIRGFIKIIGKEDMFIIFTVILLGLILLGSTIAIMLGTLHYWGIVKFV